MTAQIHDSLGVVETIDGTAIHVTSSGKFAAIVNNAVIRLALYEAQLRDRLSDLYRTMQMVATEVHIAQRLKLDQIAAKGTTDAEPTAPATAS